MRIPMSCHDCTWQEIEADEAADKATIERGEQPPKRNPWRSLNRDNWYLADIEEDNAYVETCRKGHLMKMTMQNVRFELLYESGIVAMLLGFHREAVSSIAGALERFYEFATEVLTFRAGIEQAAHGEAWKQVRSSSERQFGAFLFLYLTNFKRPFLADVEFNYEKDVSFRNQVIHQGRFPNVKETLAYAKHVFELIHDTRQALKDLDAEATHKVELLHFLRGHAAVERKTGGPKPGPDGLYRSAGSAAMPTMLNAMITDAPTDFESRLAQSKDMLWWWGFPKHLRRAQRYGMIK